jgi:hypothetical protein
MPVQRDHPRPVATEFERERARGGCVDQPQADALPRANAERLRHEPVHGHGIADAPRVAHVHEVAEAAANGGVRVQAEVAQHPEHVAVHLRRLALLHDQRAREASSHLLVAPLVRVIEEGARVRQREFVGEARAGLDGPLRDEWHAVHRVRQPDTMPVHGRGFLECVLRHNAQAVALARAQDGPRDGAVIGPGGRRRVLRRHELHVLRRGDEPRLDERGRGHSAPARRQERQRR